MVVNLAHKVGGARGREISANNRRGLNVIEQAEIRLPYIERCTASQFEMWLVKKYGPEYLQPVLLYMNGGGI